MKTLNKTSERFNNAVTKLYKAFHNGELDAWSCQACAVGNICNNKAEWASFINGVYKFKPEPCIEPDIDLFPKYLENSVIIESGYSAFELATIETIFLKETPRFRKETKEEQFKGLCAVIEYLCELDAIPNVMDYSKLFERDNEQPKYALESFLSC